MRNITIPALDTEIPFTTADIHYARKVLTDGEGVKGTPHIRITFDEAAQEWAAIPVGKKKGGLIVFFNEPPSGTDTHVRITSIIGTGRATYGNPISK